MARLLVQLKLRLLLNALRSSGAARVSFIISCCCALLVAVGAFFVLALFRGSPSAVDLTTVIFTVFAFGWLLMPIFAFGLDSTLDPATLQLYPLRTGPLAVGLLCASLTGAWPVANVIGLLGVTVGLARGPLGVLFAVVAVLLQVLFCVTLARLVTTTMARMLRSRHGRDFAVFLIIPIVALYEFFTQVVPSLVSTGKLHASIFNGFDAWMRWLPPGLAAHAIQDASTGRADVGLLRLAVLAAVIVVLGALWISSLNRALVTTDSSTQSSRVHGTALPFPRWGVLGAVAARFWIYQRRDPTSLAYWGMAAVIMAAVSARAIVGKEHHPGLLLAGAVVSAAFVGYFHANAAGYAGPPFIYEATALTGRRQLRAYFWGQDIALSVIGLPLLVAVAIGLAAAAGRWEYGFFVAALAVTGIGAALGISNVLTATLAYPMTKRPSNPMRQPAPGYQAYGIGGVVANLGTVAVTAIPMIVAVAILGTHPSVVWYPVLLGGGAIYGFALLYAGVRLAAIAAEQKLPELCQIAMRSQLS
jgi:ABC-2 type transport system permease protein